MQSKRSVAETVAEDYYDSSDADRFYELVWGGEDIHIGLYAPGLSIHEASRLTVEKMASEVTLSANSRVLDLGAGYGGAARYLAATHGCHVTCFNLSEVQNKRNRILSEQQGLQDRIEVLHGSFEDIPCKSRSFDLVWSQDAFLHSSKKDTVIAEINRVLKPGGEVLFTDPMQADTCPAGVLQPVYDRLNLESLASPGFYLQAFKDLGYDEAHVIELTFQLRNHYATVKETLESRYRELSLQISKPYLDRMILGLEHWVTAADTGYLAWGILHFRKPS
jgi:cyclopropane fatty-acyl-phospholipid synthase-like methyltransferase